MLSLENLESVFILNLLMQEKIYSGKEVNPNLNLDDGIILLLNEDFTILQGVETITYLDNICIFKGLIF